MQVEIVMGLEEEFHIEMAEEKAQKITTVEEAAELIDELVQAKKWLLVLREPKANLSVIFFYYDVKWSDSLLVSVLPWISLYLSTENFWLHMKAFSFSKIQNERVVLTYT